jgi:hypothetical protein
MQIETIVLSHDARGISKLKDYLPADSYSEGAQFLLDEIRDNDGPVIITTGLYIAAAKAPETDGPPGAIAIGNALAALGKEVIYVTDSYTSPLFTDDVLETGRVVVFPIADPETSKEFAQKLRDEIKPACLIAIERAGLNQDKKYLNMAGRDITACTAKIDYLFYGQENTLGIGDGGNEIGMGNLAQYIPAVDTLPDNPAVTCVTKLLLASISNWGGYGLVAALAKLTGKNLLPSVDWEKKIIRKIIEKGAVDGASGKAILAVDNFDLNKNAWALTELNKLKPSLSDNMLPEKIR